MSLATLVEVGGARVEEHAPFGARTTYRVGGSVRALVTLSSLADLDELGPLMLASGLDLFVLGNGSNLLVADGEHEVLGVHLVDEFEGLTTRDEGDVVVVDVGAGMHLPVAARRLAKTGIAGFEWAVGVPGSFGGAAVMNAGGHGSDINESLVSVRVWHDGATRTWSKELLDYGYRRSSLRDDDVVVSLRLHLRRGESEESQERIREIVRWRREHQPGGANAGSAFRNPEDDFAGRLIEEAGCKGLRVGTAVVSEKHANFIIADADGRGNDVYELLTTVQARVKEHSGVELVSEHRFLGFESP